MSTTHPAGEPTIIMTRVYDAPRDQVWLAITDAEHVRQWWGGAGCSSPVCEMDVRPGGLWTHLMRYTDGREIHLHFVFLEVKKPERLVWQNADRDKGKQGVNVQFTSTLEDLGERTRYTLVGRFDSIAERDAAVEFGFAGPIERSHDRLAEYLKTL